MEISAYFFYEEMETLEAVVISTGMNSCPSSPVFHVDVTEGHVIQ